jgi:nucleotide-binding universal stress UspA family protein
MFRRILVGVDGSEAGYKALNSAATLARGLNAELWGLGVEEKLPRYAATVGEVDDALRERSAYFEEIARTAIAQAATRGVELTMDVVAGHAAETIIRYAEHYHFDLIVLGFHGHHGPRVFSFGSVVDRVSEHASCSVLIVR